MIISRVYQIQERGQNGLWTRISDNYGYHAHHASVEAARERADDLRVRMLGMFRVVKITTERV